MNNIDDHAFEAKPGQRDICRCGYWEWSHRYSRRGLDQ